MTYSDVQMGTQLTKGYAELINSRYVVEPANMPTVKASPSVSVWTLIGGMLGGERFLAILKVLRNSFDYIIIDTPPLGSVIDAAVAAKNCDGTVLVVENNAVSYKFVQTVKSQLDKTGSRILG